jgi:hypothetical protein
MITLLLCCLFVIALPAQAEVSLSQMQILVRALGFLNNPPTGTITLGIVYSASEPGSEQEANALHTLLDDGLQVGNLYIKSVLVNINDAANADVNLFFLTKHLGAEGRKILTASQKKQILCVTTDTSAVVNGSCGLGIVSQPKIQILVNHGAASSSGASFSTVFNMMITEY